MPNSSNSLLKNLRLATKIYLVFAALLALFLILFGVNYLGLHATVDNFQQFTKASQTARQLGEIDRDVIDLQKQVSIYALTRNSANAPRIRNLGNELNVSITDAMEFASSDNDSYRLNQMRQNLSTYLENFETVVEERQIRSQLVEDALLRNATDVRATLESIARESSTESKDRQTARRALAILALAQSGALEFLNDPDSAVADNALRAFKRAATEIGQLESIESLSAGEENITDLASLQQTAADLEPSFLRTVQATRAYLYLVNVVMAGEAAEFAHHSHQLQQESAQQLSQIASDTTARTNQTHCLTTMLSSVAVVLGVLITMGLAKTIIDPISAITTTFRKLLEREPVDSIPGLDRNDEIGEMARAAQLLRDQSYQTEVLLQQTENLARDLEVKAEQLQKNNDDLDSFAYVASHDLKSPLRAISNVSQWIVEDAADVLPEKSREHLNVLRARVRRMETLLDDLLDYSRVSRAAEETSEVNVATMLQEVKQTIEWPKNVALHLGDNLPIFETQATSLSRVFMNLMTNSVKYRGDNDPQITITCQETQGTDGKEFYEFTVADNGIGIAEKYHATVFQMFKRLHLNSEIDGTGMGLALVEKMVKSYGGTIWLESSEGQGAIFRFTWPQLMPIEEPTQTATDSTTYSAPSL